MISKFKVNPLFIAISILLLVVLVFGFYVPLMPIMPARVDGERYAANEALALGMQFGRDFIFTSGPYASIYTKLYHPFTDPLMIFGATLISIATWISGLILAKNADLSKFIFFVLILLLIPAPGDTYLLFVPFLISLACIRFNDIFTARPYLRYLTLIFMLVPLGLLPLVKGTMLILSASSIAICSLNFLLKRYFLLALLSVLIPVISTLIFWFIAGQNILNIPTYLNSIIEISSPYSEAMSISIGGKYDLPIYFVLAICSLVLIYLNKNKFAKVDQLSLFLIFVLYIFVSFKAGFVRHDLGHVRISFGCILFAISCIPLLITSRKVFGASILLIAIGCYWMFYYGMYFRNGLGYLEEVRGAYLLQIDGLQHRLKNDSFIKNEFDRSNNSLRAEYFIPPLEGVTDIYSYNQPYLIASGNAWSSRPIIHSYSSYSKNLIRINNDHLLGKNAPDNIIFAIQVMDYRLPALEDGLSWLTLLQMYSPVKKNGEYLYLTRKDEQINWQLKQVSEIKYKFGDAIEVPPSIDGIVAARITFQKTLLGKVSTFLFKPSQIKIILNLEGGAKREFRLISTMTESEFILSPLVENIVEFESLYEKKVNIGPVNKVQSFSIENSDGRFKNWSDTFILTFFDFVKN